MLQKKEKQILFVLLPLIILICGLLYSLNFDVDITNVNSQNRVYDTTDFPFDGRTIARLSCVPIEYVQGELLTPEEFDASDSIMYGPASEAGNVVTSRLRIIVPENRIYAFAGRTGSYASRIFVNGVLLSEVGTPGTSEDSMIASESFISFTARPENSVIEIVHQSSNFVFGEIFNHSPWHMGF